MDINEIATQRQDVHKGHSTLRLTDNPYYEDTVGVAGEAEFAKQFNMSVDTSARIGGDNGIDFQYKGKSIDVKTAKKAYNVLIKEKDIDRCADVIILAKYNDDKSVELLGWATKEEMKQCPKKIFNTTLNIVNYYKHVSTLRRMDKLAEYLQSNPRSPAVNLTE